MPLMLISEARFGSNYVEQDVRIIAPGIGITDCWECGGDGDWSKFAPWEPPAGSMPCVNCKGTGKRYVDAWELPKMARPIIARPGGPYSRRVLRA